MSSRMTRNNRRPKSRVLPKLLLIIVIAIFLVFGGGCISVYALGSAWLSDLPDYTDATSYNVAQKTKVYASDGTTLLAEFFTEDREPLESLDDIADCVVKGTVDTEDVRFYEHNGVDMVGIARALYVDILAGSAEEGASTIDQQFVRNTILSEEMTDISVKRKVREAYIAMQLEKLYTKDEILLMYLNTINYGHNCYGIEAASRFYFGKSAKDLTLSEGALLVGVPQAPSANNPIDNMEGAIERRNLVLDRLATAGDITAEEAAAAKAEEVELHITINDDDGIHAYPYFASYVRHLLVDEFGTATVFQGGLTVYTTLDTNMQDSAEYACDTYLSGIEPYAEASLVTIDPYTGYILAMVGGKSYEEDEFNIAWQGSRQPGSCFKMFTLAASIEMGVDPNTSISASSPITINGWRVENYANTQMGQTTIARATWASSNTAFARLITAIGAEPVVDIAHRMGIESELQAVPSITLGSQGVCPLEMANAYATLVTDGVYHKHVAITKIVDRNGATIFDVEKDGPEGVQAISPQVAFATREVLKGVINAGTGTSANIGVEQAGKTGTSENYRDSWFCSITPQYSTAIWCGSRDESKYVSDNTGGANCCRIWRLYMLDVYSYYPASGSFSNPGYPPYGTRLTLIGGSEKKSEKKSEEPTDEPTEVITDEPTEEPYTEPPVTEPPVTEPPVTEPPEEPPGP